MVILRLKPPRRIACTEPDTRDRQLLADCGCHKLMRDQNAHSGTSAHPQAQ
jgi:hypothetical protein